MAKDMKKEKMQVYNAKGSKAVDAAEDEEGDFKKGGVAKKKRDHEKLKSGGHVEGDKAKHMAHKPRGEHHKRKAGGRTPYSSGHATTGEMDGHSGHESERPEG